MRHRQNHNPKSVKNKARLQFGVFPRKSSASYPSTCTQNHETVFLLPHTGYVSCIKNYNMDADDDRLDDSVLLDLRRPEGHNTMISSSCPGGNHEGTHLLHRFACRDLRIHRTVLNVALMTRPSRNFSPCENGKLRE